jgi:hypothetical protein
MLRTRAEHPQSFFFLSGQLIRKLQIAFGSPAQGRRMSQLSSTDKFSVSQRITERSMTFCNPQTMPEAHLDSQEIPLRTAQIYVSLQYPGHCAR